MADRWDYYEITFSLREGDEDDALSVFEDFKTEQAGSDVVGAVFSSGNDAPHPFSKAAVERAAQAAARFDCSRWDAEDEDADWYRDLVAAVLTAATSSKVDADAT